MRSCRTTSRSSAPSTWTPISRTSAGKRQSLASSSGRAEAVLPAALILGKGVARAERLEDEGRVVRDDAVHAGAVERARALRAVHGVDPHQAVRPPPALDVALLQAP